MFAIAAVIAVAIGTLVRQSAGAIAIILVWALVLESLLGAIPALTDASQWFPFNAGGRFVQPTDGRVFQDVVAPAGPSPVQGLLIFAGTAVGLWIAALLVRRRRDA